MRNQVLNRKEQVSQIQQPKSHWNKYEYDKNGLRIQRVLKCENLCNTKFIIIKLDCARMCIYRYYHTGRLGLCLATLFRVFTDWFSSLCAPFNVVSLTLLFTQITHTLVLTSYLARMRRVKSVLLEWRGRRERERETLPFNFITWRTQDTIIIIPSEGCFLQFTLLGLYPSNGT